LSNLAVVYFLSDPDFGTGATFGSGFAPALGFGAPGVTLAGAGVARGEGFVRFRLFTTTVVVVTSTVKFSV